MGAPNSGQGGWCEVDTPVPWKRVGVSSRPVPTPRGVSSIASQEYNNLVSECPPSSAGELTGGGQPELAIRAFFRTIRESELTIRAFFATIRDSNGLIN